MQNININNVIKKGSLCILFFIYIYPLNFNLIPFTSTRIIIGTIGIFLLIINGLTISFKKIILIKKGWLYILLSLLTIFIIAISTNFINSTKETYFLTYPFSIIALLCASYTLTRAVKAVYRKITFDIIAHYIVISVEIQMIITVLMFIFPLMRDFLLGITNNSVLEIAINSNKQIRIIGFGSQFFDAGIVNCFALILITILIKHKIHKTKKASSLPLVFVLIAIVGTIMARTTLIGIFLSFAILLYKPKIIKFKPITFKPLIILTTVIALIVYFIPSSILENINTASRFGFEIFYNYFEKGELNSESTNQLLDMYNTYPQNLKTWLIGDGFYANPLDPTLYYMNIDVGYARLLFYFGIIGLFAYLFFQFTIIKYANKVTANGFSLFFFTIGILILILNFKGMTDLTSLVILFIFCEQYPKFVAQSTTGLLKPGVLKKN